MSEYYKANIPQDVVERAQKRVAWARQYRMDLMEKGFSHEQACRIAEQEKVNYKAKSLLEEPWNDFWND